MQGQNTSPAGDSEADAEDAGIGNDDLLTPSRQNKQRNSNAYDDCEFGDTAGDPAESMSNNEAGDC